jgi:hypothetical protein
MNTLRTSRTILCAAATLAVLALNACGGGDTASRLDLNNPSVRFVHAAAGVAAVTLYDAGAAQTNETAVPYGFASNYSNINMSTDLWSVATSVGATAVGSVTIAPVRGNLYTIVALDGVGTATSAILIVDPYNKSLNSDGTFLRVVNAAPAVASIDVYVTAVGTPITTVGVTPLIAATPTGQPGPPSGSDSAVVSGGVNYQVTITAAGTKTILFTSAPTAPVSFSANQDALLVVVPDPVTAGKVSAFIKVDGSNAAVPLVAG